jgi:hypothetical protein
MMEQDAGQEGQLCENWAHTIQFSPTKLFRPTTYTELANALKQAVADKKSVRVAGSSRAIHSLSFTSVLHGVIVLRHVPQLAPAVLDAPILHDTTCALSPTMVGVLQS